MALPMTPGGHLPTRVISDLQESNPIMAAKKPAVTAAPSKAKTPVTKPAALQAAAKAPPPTSKAAATKVPAPAAGSKAAPTKGAASKAPPPAKAAPVITVTLKHLAAEIAEQQQIAKPQTDAILSGLVGLLVQHLKAGDRLRIGGLGILEVKNRPERAGRNPATGAVMTIKASKKIAFRAAKELKEAI
jgi:DNA-binding protein HU-beta